MAITFSFQHPVTLPLRRKLRKLMHTILADEGKGIHNLAIIFCSDIYLLELNNTFLAHDYLTDILTFDLSIDNKIDGEIYISVETAASNARYYKVLLFNELTRLIIHGTLHLCGYLDSSPREKRIMSQKEDRYLSLFGSL